MKPTALLIIFILLAGCAKPAAPAVKEPPAAILDEITGTVTVDGKTAALGMELSPGMTISTGASSTASLLLYKGIAVRLDENTTATVGTLSRKSVRLSQLTGTTWNKILRIAGVEEYTLQTPFTTATVRGTAFAVKVSPERAIIKVAEGTVIAEQEGKTTPVAEEQQVEATAEEISYEEYTTDGWVEQNLALDEQFVEEAAEEFIAENAGEYDEAARELDVPPEELEAWAEAYVEGGVAEIVPETTEELNTLQEEPPAEEQTPEEPASEPTAEETPLEEPIPEPLPEETVVEEQTRIEERQAARELPAEEPIME